MIWQIINDFLKLLSEKEKIKKLNALAWVYFPQPKLPKPVP